MVGCATWVQGGSKQQLMRTVLACQQLACCTCRHLTLHFLLLLLLQIVEAVNPVRDRLDACVIFPSMPAVMKLNKLGTFSMAQLGQSKSMIGEFIK